MIDQWRGTESQSHVSRPAGSMVIWKMNGGLRPGRALRKTAQGRLEGHNSGVSEKRDDNDQF